MNLTQNVRTLFYYSMFSLASHKVDYDIILLLCDWKYNFQNKYNNINY